MVENEAHLSLKLGYLRDILTFAESLILVIEFLVGRCRSLERRHLGSRSSRSSLGRGLSWLERLAQNVLNRIHQILTTQIELHYISCRVNKNRVRHTAHIVQLSTLKFSLFLARAKAFLTNGISLRHGAHHDAQTSKNTYLPFNCDNDNDLPSMV